MQIEKERERDIYYMRDSVTGYMYIYVYMHRYMHIDIYRERQTLSGRFIHPCRTAPHFLFRSVNTIDESVPVLAGAPSQQVAALPPTHSSAHLLEIAVAMICLQISIYIYICMYI